METVLGTIGVVTAGSIVNSVTTLSSNIFNIIGYIKISKHIHQNEIIKILTKTDVVSTIKLLQAIITEIPEYYTNSISVIIALKNVQEIIENIETELKDIHTKITYNESLYLMSNLRSFDCKDNLDSIELKVSILDRRRDNLFKILEVFKNLNILDSDVNKEKIKKYLDDNNSNGFEIVKTDLLL